ncbi:hypothetical protein L3Q82_012211 [Scortum barcoo]|uniref:Uncharacterized protein n=1 Tax=Scortum barcoo TaxID=214431 RepID=A0ACB8W2S2_9TELE|nr:hypothetical protein L3Q82_012211 [Scortum barcoo]
MYMTPQHQVHEGPVQCGSSKGCHQVEEGVLFRRNNAVFVLVVEHWTTSSISSTGCLRGFMGVGPHVLCGSGEGIRPCPSWYSVGVLHASMGSGDPLLRAVRSLYDLEQELGSHCRQ